MYARLVFLLLLGALCVQAQDSVDKQEDLVFPALLTSSSGRFVVGGPDRMEAFDFALWLEDITSKFERFMGGRLASGRIIIRAGFFENPKEDQGKAGIQRGPLPGSFILNILNYTSVDGEQVLHLTVGALLERWIRENGGEMKVKITEENAYQIPEWFSLGLSQNLYPHFKKRNSAEALDAWAEGALSPIEKILLSASVTNERAKATASVFTQMLFDKRRGQNVQEKLISAVSSNLVMTPCYLLGGIEEAEADDIFDSWMLKQKKTVYLPGQDAPGDLSKFKRQMLIYPESSDSFQEPVVGLGPNEAIAKKKDKKVADAAISRQIGLKLFAAGKSDEMRSLVDAYCYFLEGIAQGKMDWILRKRLVKARALLEEMERREDIDGEDSER